MRIRRPFVLMMPARRQSPRVRDTDSRVAPITTHTSCPWKGLASYYDIVVDGKTNRDGAWYYPAPSAAAADIKDHVAFWHGVSVQP